MPNIDIKFKNPCISSNSKGIFLSLKFKSYISTLTILSLICMFPATSIAMIDADQGIYDTTVKNTQESNDGKKLISINSKQEEHKQTKRLLVRFKRSLRAGTSARYDSESLLGRYAKANSLHYYEKTNTKKRAGQSIKRGPEIFDRLVALEVKDGQDIRRVKQELERNPNVESVEFDQELKIFLTPNDTRYPELWAMNNTGQTGGTVDADIDAPEAWDLNTGSAQIVVAVIDTGVDYTHPDLAPNMWINPDEVPSNGIDDDQNGYVDDIFGYDFINHDANPMDDHFHGTHVAGTIGAKGNNNLGVVGVNHSVRIMALKFLGFDGNGSSIDALDAVQYATLNGAHIISNSYGGDGFLQDFQNAINAARNAGVLFVAAAGNSNTDAPAYPAMYENVLTVSASNYKDERALGSNGQPFSNFGTHIDVTAPGQSILSTTPNNNYASYSGTSMACPHVAGLAALIKSRNFNLTGDQIENAIKSSADDIGAPGFDIYFGYGRINAKRALDLVNPAGSLNLNIQITSPASGAVISDFSSPIQIIGTASGSNFLSYQLEYTAPGISGWVALQTSSSPVNNGLLGVLTPNPAWQEGMISIRLSVQSTTGGTFYDYSIVPYSVAKLTNLKPYYEFKTSESINFQGTASGVGFLSYKLEYGKGFTPTQWTVVTQSSAPVINGNLGVFLIPQGLQGYYTFRLTVQLSSFTKQILLPIYIENQQLPNFPIIFSYQNPSFPDPFDFFGYTTPLTFAFLSGEPGLIAPFSIGPSNGWVFQPNQQPYLQISRYKPNGSMADGWPAYFSNLGHYVSSPAIGDLDKDGVPEIVVTAQAWDSFNSCTGDSVGFKLFVLRPDGSIIFSRPIEPPTISTFSGCGTSYLNFSDDLAYRMIPTLSDLDQDGYLDIIVGGRAAQDNSSGNVNAFDRNGSMLPGFPVVIPNAREDYRGWVGSFAVADMNNDNSKEIIFWIQTEDLRFKLFIYNANGTPHVLSPVIVTQPNVFFDFAGIPERPIPPVIGDVTGDGQLDLVTFHGSHGSFAYNPPNPPESIETGFRYVSVIDHAGILLPGWPVYQKATGLSLGDLDHDDIPEIIGVSGDPLMPSSVFVFKGDGTFLNGWANQYPLHEAGEWPIFNVEPVVADVNNDGNVDVVVKKGIKVPNDPVWGSMPSVVKVYAYNSNATVIDGYPKQIVAAEGSDWNYLHNGNLTIGDLDQNGYLDLMAASAPTSCLQNPNPNGLICSGKIKGWALSAPASSAQIEWSKYRGNLRNTGRYKDSYIEPQMTIYVHNGVEYVPATDNQILSQIISIKTAGTITDSPIQGIQVWFDNQVVPFNMSAGAYFWNTLNSTDGQHTIKMQVITQAGQQTVNKVVTVINHPLPVAPALLSPSDASSTNDTTPTFTWSRVNSATTYQLQLDNNPSFSNPEVNQASLNTTSFTYGEMGNWPGIVPEGSNSFQTISNKLSFAQAAPPIPVLFDGTYHWRVRAKNSNGWGSWSSVRTFKFDTANPSVSITAPENNSTIGSGTVVISASAADSLSGISKVKFYYKYGTNPAVQIGTDVTSAPYSVNWNTNGLASGGYDLTAVAYDGADNMATSAAIHVIFDNVTIPSVTWSYPNQPGTILGSFVFLTVTAADPDGINKVEFYLDGNILLGQVTSPPYQLGWSTISTADGPHTLVAKAFDNSSQQSVGVSVVMAIEIDHTPPPVPALNAPANGSSTNNPQPTFSWQAVTDPNGHGPTGYQIVIATNPAFSSPLINVTQQTTSYTPTAPLAPGTYYWHVRSKDQLPSGGNYSNFSATYSLTITG